jgi:hypothetical protein
MLLQSVRLQQHRGAQLVDSMRVCVDCWLPSACLPHAAAANRACPRYGLAVAIAFTAVVVAKRAIRSVPVLGTLTAPLLGLLPAPLLGPVLGVLAVYVRDGGDLRDVRNAIFPPKRGGEGGQFMSS